MLSENDGKRKWCKTICEMFEMWDFDYWYLRWKHQEKQWNG